MSNPSEAVKIPGAYSVLGKSPADLAAEASGGDFAENAEFGTGDLGELGGFPTECLDPVTAGMIKESARVSLVPESIPGVCALAMLSAAIGAGLHVISGRDRWTRGNLYLLCVAPSGTGKGLAYAKIAAPFLTMETMALEHWRKVVFPGLRAQKTMAEQRVAKLKERAKNPKDGADRTNILAELTAVEMELTSLTDALFEPCWVVGDVTREELANQLGHAKNECLASFSPEARGVMDVMAGRYRDGVSDEDIYLSAYTGETYKVHRRSSPSISLKSPCLTLLWMVQPDKIKEIMAKPQLENSGFFERCLFTNTKAEPQEEPDNPVSKSAESAKLWAELIGQLIKTYREHDGPPLTIIPTGDATEVLRGYFNEIVRARRTGGHLHDVTTYAARWGEQAWRLAVVLHSGLHGAKAHEAPLSADTARRAVRLAKWFAAQQLALLAPARTERESKRMLRLLDILGSGEGQSATLRDLDRRNGIDIAEVEALAKKFPQLLEIFEVKPAGAGRPSRSVRQRAPP